MSKEDPSNLTYILTSIFAVVAIALCFGLFQAVLSTFAGRFVVSIVLSAALCLPLASVAQDAVLSYNKERKEK